MLQHLQVLVSCKTPTTVRDIVAVCTVGAFEILLEALKALLCDDGFTIPSPSAAAALMTASSLLSWCSDSANHLAFAQFADKLMMRLDKAFYAASTCKFLTRKEKMWRNFHHIRCSEDFRSLWSFFLLQSVKSEASPVLYQYLTDKFFHHLITIHFTTEASTDTFSILNKLSYEELNVLRYGAGYVCRAVRKKLTPHKNNKELLLSLEELEDTEENTPYDPSRDWIEITNRGGIISVTDEAFEVFCSIEGLVREHFRKDRAKEISGGMKAELCTKITSNEEVQSKWEVIARDMDDEVGRKLLAMITELWVTVRGFSYAGAWMELYKQRAKKTLQRSKGLRKVLYTD